MSLLKPNSEEFIYFYDTRQYNTVCNGNMPFLNDVLIAVKQPPGAGKGYIWRILEDYGSESRYPIIQDTYIIEGNTTRSWKQLDKICLNLLPIVEVKVQTNEYGEVATVLDAPRVFMNMNEAIKDNKVKEDIFKGDDNVENLALLNLVPRILPEWLYDYNPLQMNNKTRFFVYLALLGVGLYGANDWKKNGLSLKNGVFTGVGAYSGIQILRAFIRNPKFVSDIFKR